MSPDRSVLIEVAVDLSHALRAEDRYARLVTAVRRAIPCDAAALLRVDGQQLVPLATHGLVPEIMGRVFTRGEHPRLDILCASEGPVRFAADSRLPDPFDGLVQGDAHALSAVHSCLGCPLRVDGELLGVLTADALRPGAFEDLDQADLSMLAALAGATLRAGILLETHADFARHQGLVARTLMNEKLGSGGEILGSSAPMARLRSDIELVAPTEMTVLISGETGVGKELVARAVHAASHRHRGPLIQVNCAALPESLVESELFGHVRGAFTGADRERPGKFEIAKGGTLFLDEIGELPLTVQPKFLRAIQTGEIQRVGSDRPQHVDVRLLAATNRDLEAEVAAGRFRADLYHRLHGFPLAVPPLRERRDDIPVLVGAFADRSRLQLGIGPVRVADGARRLLQSFDWPGNVRELENVVARLVLRAARRVERGCPVILDIADVEPEVRRSGAPAAGPTGLDRSGTLEEQVDAFKREVIHRALERTGGNWSEAARCLGVARSNLRVTARRLGWP